MSVAVTGLSPSRRRTALYGAIAAGVVVALFLAVLATRKSAQDQQARSPLLGHPAPPIVGTDIVSGAPFNLGTMRGKFVLVNFFASWCVPCQDEQPQLVAFAHAQRANTAVVGVLFDDTAGPARSFLVHNGGDWPAVTDPNSDLALNYGVRGPPESYVIDPQGTVIAKFISEVSAARLEQLVQEAA